MSSFFSTPSGLQGLQPISAGMDKEKSFAEIFKQSLKRYSDFSPSSNATESESFLGVELLDLTLVRLKTIPKPKSRFGDSQKGSSFSYRGYPTHMVKKSAWPLSPEEESAFHLVRSYAPELGNPFWPKQLKRIKRQVFLRTHPDHGGGEELFRQVFAAFHVLEAALHRHLGK